MHRPEIAGSARAFDLIRQTPTDAAPGERLVVVEAPVAIEVNGLGYAVMMATPADLEDFALGFALSERIIDDPADLKDVASHAIGEGWLLRLTIKDAAFAPIGERIRHRVADSGCGLCGMGNLEQVLRPLPPVQNPSQATPEALFRALTSLRDVQPLNAATGAAHAAAFCSFDGAILTCREDVGRHNAFDKLIGGLARSGLSAVDGFALLSSRCSLELVDKAIIAGFPLLVTLSAPTSLAVDRARSHDLALVALARADALLVLNDPDHQFGR